MQILEIDILRRLPYLAGLSRDDLSAAAPMMTTFSVGVGEVLIQAGEVDDALLLVLEGEVAIEVGEPALEVARARVGDVLGETALFRPAWRRQATLRTATPCRVVLLDGARIAALRASGSAVLAAMERHALQSIGRRLRGVALQAPPAVLEPLASPAPETLLARLNRWLWQEARTNNSSPAPSATSLLLSQGAARSPAALANVAGLFRSVAVREEQVLVSAVDAAPALLLVASGVVELRDPHGSPHEQRVVGRLGPGQLVNPLSLVHGHVPLARAVSVQSGWVHRLPRETVAELLSSPRPEGGALRELLYTSLFESLVRRNTAWHDRWRSKQAA
jgi:CRP-like cAMP-binding protein